MNCANVCPRGGFQDIPLRFENGRRMTNEENDIFSSEQPLPLLIHREEGFFRLSVFSKS